MLYHLLPYQVVISLSVFFCCLASADKWAIYLKPIFNAPYFTRFLKYFRRPVFFPFRDKTFIDTVLGASYCLSLFFYRSHKSI